MDTTTAPGPTINLTAGTKGPPTYSGNVDLGQGGVFGGATVNVTAQGNITGFIVSRQNSSIIAAQSFNGTVLSGGTANLSAGGSIGGTVIGISGVTATGATGSATLLGQNVSVNGGGSQSTLGTSAAATSTSQAAAQQASSDTKQIASNDATASDDDEKKKAKRGPTLTRRVGRVTVILPSKAL